MSFHSGLRTLLLWKLLTGASRMLQVLQMTRRAWHKRMQRMQVPSLHHLPAMTEVPFVEQFKDHERYHEKPENIAFTCGYACAMHSHTSSVRKGAAGGADRRCSQNSGP